MAAHLPHANFVDGLLLNMTSSEDKEQLHALNRSGALLSRDSYKSSLPWVSSTYLSFLWFSHFPVTSSPFRWKHKPTPIAAPSSSVSDMSPRRLGQAARMAHESSRNPFGQIRNRRVVGSLTSARVASIAQQVQRHPSSEEGQDRACSYS